MTKLTKEKRMEISDFFDKLITLLEDYNLSLGAGCSFNLKDNSSGKIVMKNVRLLSDYTDDGSIYYCWDWFDGEA